MTNAHKLNADHWGRGQDDWRCGFLAIMAESAYRWAWDIESHGDRSRKLRAAIEEMRQIDVNLQRWADQMTEALERRAELTDLLGIHADWTGPGIDVWDMLEATANRPEFMGTCLDSQAKLGTFLRYMRETTRATPELEDLLAQLAMSMPGVPYARRSEDAEALKKAKGSKAGSWPERVRVFLAKLEKQRWRDTHGQEQNALDCFTPEMLSTLLNVMAGFNPHDGGPPALGIEAVEKALQRYHSADH